MASEGHEVTDAETFAEWGIDYLKFDACHWDSVTSPASFKAMGEALKDTHIVYSCSWGTHMSTAQNFTEMVDSGCNLWRLWHDIEAKKGWSEVPRISNHWAGIVDSLAPFSGPNAKGKGYHDPDQLIAGDQQYSLVEARAQLGLWVMLSAPLILGNRLVDPALRSNMALRKMLQSKEVLAVNRDPLQQMGFRLPMQSPGGVEVWVRKLTGGAVAVLFFNNQTPSPGSPSACEWGLKRGVQAISHVVRLAGLKGAKYNFTR
jgi:hypothetical protein